MNRRHVAVMLAAVLLLAGSFGAWAQAEPAQQAKPAETTAGRSGTSVGLIALAAALAVGLTALATGLAQGRIGSAGAGTLAEKPDTAGSIILLVALPETMVILGFVTAIVILFVL
jgi:V/A-type H+-transporting ATPase subunit K